MALGKILNPILFQGSLKKKNYFEGWYYKNVSQDEKTIVSFIPGISLFENDEHSFIQYIYKSIDDNNDEILETGYCRYSIDDFSYFDKPFKVQIGKSVFTENLVSIDIESDLLSFNGHLDFGALTPIKKSILFPNIMGYFAYIPAMECYHGLISMKHDIKGKISISNNSSSKSNSYRTIDFNNGSGYLEKDWGKSFPRKYIWMQCNHFEKETTSIVFSVADIPFGKRSFEGFLCNFCINGNEYRFATYNNSKIILNRILADGFLITLENRHAKIEITAKVNSSGTLIAPKHGEMKNQIKEELSGEIHIVFRDKKTNYVFEGKGRSAGIEIVGY